MLSSAIQVRHLVDRLAKFYSSDEARIWLCAQHPLLNRKRAIDLIYTGQAEDVLHVIESLDESTYT
jgi:uncharacterized protein (DUF2384 family)